MAYENVDVSRAKNAINNCLNSIRHAASDDIISQVPGSTNWVSDSKSTFVSAVDKLVNTRYKELVDYLNKSLKTLDQIDNYKKLQTQNASYDSQIRSKSSELNTLRNKYNRMDDKSTTEARNTKTKIDRLDREIRDLNNKKSNNSNDMGSINKNISI